MMMIANDDSPHPDAWALRLRAFLEECLASTPAEETRRVREGAALLGGGAPIAGSDKVEAMLLLGAPESAVLRIIGADTAFMLSRGQGETCLATMVAAGAPGEEPREILAEASTLALALLSAHVATVIAGIEGSGPALPLPGCDPR